MRIFVTGASGFVGQKLIPRLSAAGHEAIGADREVDVSDSTQIARALSEHAPDAVVHLAAMSSVAQSWKDPASCYRLNFLGTRCLLRAVEAVIPEARVLLIGSADQYAATAAQARPLAETTPLRPRSPYARSKAAGELLGREAARRGLDVVCVRAFNHTGAGQPDHFVASSFARQVAAIRLGRAAPLMRVGNLDSVRDFLHVDDVLRAYLALLDPGVAAGVYNVASEQSTPIREVLDRLFEIAEIEAAVEVDPERWRDTDWLVGDASKLRGATGWRPEVELDEILRELFADWLEREGGGA